MKTYRLPAAPGQVVYVVSIFDNHKLTSECFASNEGAQAHLEQHVRENWHKIAGSPSVYYGSVEVEGQSVRNVADDPGEQPHYEAYFRMVDGAHYVYEEQRIEH